MPGRLSHIDDNPFVCILGGCSHGTGNARGERVRNQGCGEGDPNALDVEFTPERFQEPCDRAGMRSLAPARPFRKGAAPWGVCESVKGRNA